MWEGMGRRILGAGFLPGRRRFCRLAFKKKLESRPRVLPLKLPTRQVNLVQRADVAEPAQKDCILL